MNRRARVRGVASLAVTLLSSTLAHAVMLDPDGYGQALIFPYYTARASALTGATYNTLLSVTNPTSDAKALRIRFREANTGTPVLELNVFLSALDMWTAAITPAAGDGAAITSSDRSCTQPILVAPGQSSGTRKLSPALYAGDGFDQTAARTREGYIEVLEMGTVPQTTTLFAAITHDNGSPTCVLPADATIALTLAAPSGNLRGSAVIINVEEGTSYSYDAVAFRDWRNAPLYTAVGMTQPTLTSVIPLTSTVIDRGSAFISQWTAGIDAINAVLAAAHVESEYMIDPDVRGGTDIVYTMPTKREGATGTARAPFVAAFDGTGTFACEGMVEGTFDREAGTTIGQLAAVCWATSVLQMRDARAGTIPVLGSAVTVQVARGSANAGDTTILAGFQGATFSKLLNPAVAQGLPTATATTVVNLKTGTTTSVNGVVYVGLPVIGVAFTRFVNGTVVFNGAKVLSTYGTTTTLKATRLRTP